ncbi:MAG: diaminopropionate ammonia-lyase [Clostridium sp.]|nr:diaminopropionate ammonia-lyase [Clostridium sp.]
MVENTGITDGPAGGAAAAPKKTARPAAPAWLEEMDTVDVRQFHRSVPGYAPTPLRELKAYAEAFGVKSVLVKDESFRFGLKAFKGLGGVYAVNRVICRELGIDPAKSSLELLQSGRYRPQIERMVFITTTDGNHGKGVSWAAGLLGCKAYVYMPKGSVEARAQAIRDAGRAEVFITDMNYDDCVRFTAKKAEENGWFLVQDTSWDGYEEIPKWIMRGYTTLLFEAAEQMRELGYDRPTHIFLQAGVGAMAGGVLGAAQSLYRDRMPVVSTVEPEGVACIFESARCGDGMPHPATGSGETIMAGLNCGEPCTLAWHILDRGADYYFAVPDSCAARGMRVLSAPMGNGRGTDPRVVSGESGAAPMGLLSLLLEKESFRPFREKLGLDENAVILLINTEGDTDPEGYRHIVCDGAYPWE